jgi:hypothetical protein
VSEYDVIDLVDRLNAWGYDLSVGRKCIGADQDLRTAAIMLLTQYVELAKLTEAEANLAEALNWIEELVSAGNGDCPTVAAARNYLKSIKNSE